MIAAVAKASDSTVCVVDCVQNFSSYHCQLITNDPKCNMRNEKHRVMTRNHQLYCTSDCTFNRETSRDECSTANNKVERCIVGDNVSDMEHRNYLTIYGEKCAGMITLKLL